MSDDWESPKMEVRGPTRQPEGCMARPPSWPRQAPSWMPGGPPRCPLSPIQPPWGRNPKNKVLSAFLRRHGAETYRREKPSPAGRFRRGDHLPEGEIIAIVVVIVTGIIEIIINIIPNISTISISIPSHLTIATLVVIRTTYPLYSVGVDYYFVVNAIEFCWRIIIVPRLFIIYLSPLIMISFMSCE